MYLLSITAAERSLRLGNAYFVPDDLTTETLISAVERGVAVEVLVPGARMDAAAVRSASRHRWGRLLDNGVRIFEFEPTMYHCKTIIIDDLWTSVGSANFDNRSFRLNDEANLNVVDRDIAARENRSFNEGSHGGRGHISKVGSRHRLPFLVKPELFTLGPNRRSFVAGRDTAVPVTGASL